MIGWVLLGSGSLSWEYACGAQGGIHWGSQGQGSCREGWAPLPLVSCFRDQLGTWEWAARDPGMAILVESTSHAPTSAHFLLKDWPVEDSLPCHIFGGGRGREVVWENHRLFYLMEAREPSLSSE